MTDTRRLREARGIAEAARDAGEWPEDELLNPDVVLALLDVGEAARPILGGTYYVTPDQWSALRAALDRLDSHEKADPLHREAGRGVGRDGDTEVETIRWDDGSYTVADVRRSGSHEKADARDDPEFGHLVDSDVQP